MTDTTTQTPPTTATTPADSAAPAASAAPAPAADTPKDSNTPPDGAGKTEPSSSTAAPEGGAPAADKTAQATNDGKADPTKAQDGQAPSDKSKPDGQSSDTDKPKDGEGEGKPDALPYQPSDFTLPEGMELDADAFAAAAPVLKAHNVPKEAAQELVNVAATMVSKVIKSATDSHLEVVKGWGDQTKEEFGKGGEAAFDKERATAQAAINRFLSAEERQQLQHYGLGNFPAVFRMAHALGTMMAEDRPGIPTGAGGSKEETLAEVWYPQTQQT